MTYMQLLQKTSTIMGKKRLIFYMPLFTVGLSKWWVSIFANSDFNFVSPLVESLKHRMIPSNEYSDLYKIDFTPIETSIKRALSQNLLLCLLLINSLPKKILSEVFRESIIPKSIMPNG